MDGAPGAKVTGAFIFRRRRMISRNKFGFWTCFVCRRKMRNCGWAKFHHLEAHLRKGEMNQKQMNSYMKIQNIKRMYR